MSFTDTTEAGQYLKFKLDEEIYALELKQLKEVMAFSKVTKVPRMPEYIRGVIKLRSEIVPVVDLRLKFGMKKTEKTSEACIIVIEMSMEGETILLGALADSIQEVIILEPGQILPPPKIGDRLNTAFLKGIGKINDELVMIVDADKIFSSDGESVSQYPQEKEVLSKEDNQRMS